jgi:signal transduction histidine kinase
MPSATRRQVKSKRRLRTVKLCFGCGFGMMGKGIDPKHLLAGRDGHWGLPGMRERADQIGAQLEIWSEVGAGTEVELRIPGSSAYETARGRSGLRLFRIKKAGSDER